jgi:hypothetical protein
VLSGRILCVLPFTRLEKFYRVCFEWCDRITLYMRYNPLRLSSAKTYSVVVVIWVNFGSYENGVKSPGNYSVNQRQFLCFFHLRYTSNSSLRLPLTTSNCRGCWVSWLKQLTLLTCSVLLKVPPHHWANGSRLYKGENYLHSRGKWRFCVPSKTLSQWPSTASQSCYNPVKSSELSQKCFWVYSGGAIIMRGFCGFS